MSQSLCLHHFEVKARDRECTYIADCKLITILLESKNNIIKQTAGLKRVIDSGLLVLKIYILKKQVTDV